MSSLSFIRLRFFLGFSAILVVAALYVVTLSGSVFAEETDINGCSGRITGTSVLDNVNSGRTSFDAHKDANGVPGILTDLSIIGQGAGLAPANFADAACAKAENGIFDGTSYDHSILGWAWNTNLGFVSFECQGGVNDAGDGGGVACGGINYGVHLSVPDGGGNRDLLGYAWSPTFGWIQFKGSGAGQYLSAITDIDDTPGVDDFRNVVLEDALNPQSYDTYKVYVEIISPGNAEVKIYRDAVLLGTKVVQKNEEKTFGGEVIFEALSGSFNWEGDSPHVRFQLKTVASGPIDYGVVRNSDGDLSGYAWTQAKVWMKFDGVRVGLPGEELPEEVDPCVNQTGICASVVPAGEGGMRIADGVDGYNINLYLRDPESLTPLSDIVVDQAAYDDFVNGIKFVWSDTVKINQLPAVGGGMNSVGDALKEVKTPWANGLGAVTFKPLVFADFSEAEPGHFVSSQIVASYAPTTGGNLSSTTNTSPAYTVSNERPAYDDLSVSLEANRLRLARIEFGDLVDGGNPIFSQGVEYPNGRPDMPLDFIPAIFVSELFAGANSDQINGYRGIPETVKIGTDIIGDFLNNPPGSKEAKFKLAYDDLTTRSCAGGLIGENDPVFEYNFTSDINGSQVTNGASLGEGDTLTVPVDNILSADDVLIVASLPTPGEGQEPVELPCAVAESPYLKTEVSYIVGGKNVKYLSNHLPRIISGGVYNPVAVIHGTVLSQLVGDVQAGKAIDTSGYVNVNKVRDAVNENLKKYLGTVALTDGQDCVIGDLPDNEAVDGGPNCTKDVHYKVFTIGDEKVFYTKGNNVFLQPFNGIWKDSWIVVSDGGNVFIDGNLYDDDGDRISIVAFRDRNNYETTGHVYLNPDVQNVQATIVAEGAVFSYSGDEDTGIDGNSGEPVWSSYGEMLNILKNQLLIEGAVFSRNTIGGADLDQGNNPKNYLLLGGGEVIKLEGQIVDLEDRMRAQVYDLNYLRMFRLIVETSEEGLPIDQKCDRALTPDDILYIGGDGVLCGARQPCDSNGLFNQAYACDGIDPLTRYSANIVQGQAAGPTGDLVSPSVDQQAQGLGNTDFDPVYIFYQAPPRDSFLFSKAGTLSIN